MMTRTFDILRFQLNRFPNERALGSRGDGHWRVYSIAECIAEVDRYSLTLLNLGIKAGDRVVMVPHAASAEWLFFDLAVQQIGAISVPVHDTLDAAQLHHILRETEAWLCIFANAEQGAHFLGDGSLFPKLRSVFLHAETTDPNGLNCLLDQGPPEGSYDLKALRAAVIEDDLSAIIYTSGTTGIPKGVMLSHKNIVSNLRAIVPILPVFPGKVGLSFLPFSHVLERMAIYTYIAAGASVYLPVDRDYINAAFREVRPHLFTAVPRILEKMYDLALAERARRGWLGRRIMDWALVLGRQYTGRTGPNLWYHFQLEVARLLVFKAMKRRLGGRVEGILVGAAWLRPELGRLFGAMGIKVREGYGMTETSPVVAMNQFKPGLFSFGTVGLPVPGVEVRIDQPDENGEGEILVRGPNVMKGYYKQPAATSSVLDEEGWLRTGDVGKWVKKRFLQVTDRKKDIFKTSSGEYIAPQVMENHFRESPFIEQLMVIGFQRPYLTAIIKPNFELLEAWAKDQNIHWTSAPYMVHNIKVRQKMEAEIQRLNTSLPNYQNIRAFHLTDQEWTVDSGLLTYTMKPVRTRILEKFGKEIELLYKAPGKPLPPNLRVEDEQEEA